MRAFVGAMAVGVAILAIGGCQAVADQATYSGPMLNDAAGQQPLAESLFKSDQAVLSNQEINRILSSRVYAPAPRAGRGGAETYQRQQLFGGGTVHAYCTVEAVLLDTRSGIVTETAVRTQSFNAPRTSKDLEFEETAARAEQSAIAQALVQAAEQLSADLRAEPLAPASQRAFAGGDGKP